MLIAIYEKPEIFANTCRKSLIIKKILFKNISDKIKLINGKSYTSREIGNIIRRIGLKIKRINQGTAVIVNNEVKFKKLLDEYCVVSEDGELSEVK